ncbi:MAG TPA: polysaccharide deacetylase family protein [Solirubrobacteraceae bacterium]|nr:polysaccharide deacetylase family protein [Solirubrobacteraceae bacterium]
MSASDDRCTLLLSIDFEDWHQLVRRRVGVSGWQEPGPALARQTDRLLSLLAELGVRATFFILGMAARAHPELVRQIIEGGHEIACHGDAHVPVSSQTRQQFAADLSRARETIHELAGRQPIGYRAPAFSITRASPWAFDVLAEQGFGYDASEHDTPRVRDPLTPNGLGPRPLQMEQGRLWEFPVAVWRTKGLRVPVGGASYWSGLPTPLILKGLRAAGPMAGLYLHPYELDPQLLLPRLPRSARPPQRAQGIARAAQRNLARWRAADVLRAIAGRHRLIPYGEAYAELRSRAPASS